MSKVIDIEEYDRVQKEKRLREELKISFSEQYNKMKFQNNWDFWSQVPLTLDEDSKTKLKKVLIEQKFSLMGNYFIGTDYANGSSYSKITNITS